MRTNFSNQQLPLTSHQTSYVCVKLLRKYKHTSQLDICPSRLVTAENRPFASASPRLVGPRGSAVERQSLASVLLPSCTRPVADG